MARHLIPFKINLGGLIEIKASINGKKGRFILDTGASNCVVALGKEEQFSIISEKNDELAKGLGTTGMQSLISYQNHFQFEKCSLKNQTLIVLDLSHVNHSLEEKGLKPIDGIIGGDLLKRAKASIHYSSNKLHLSDQ